MVGNTFMIVDLLFLTFPLLLSILAWIDFRKKKNGARVIRFVLFVLLAALWLPVYGHALFYRMQGFFLLRSIRSDMVASISIGSSTWNDPIATDHIVSTFAFATWHVPAHDPGGPFEDMTIDMKSGEVNRFQVGRYRANMDGCLVLTSSISDAYIPELCSILITMGHILPER